MIVTNIIYDDEDCPCDFCEHCPWYDKYPNCEEGLIERIDSYELIFAYEGCNIGSFIAEPNGHISDLSIWSDEMRDQGFGTQMLLEGLEALKKLGLTYFYLETYSDNYRARHVYEKIGFICTGFYHIDGSAVRYEMKIGGAQHV